MNNAADISTAFVEARLGARPLSGFPGVLPSSLKEAYDIQNLSIGLWPDRVIGWKVGGIPPHLHEKLGADRLAGPIFQDAVKFQNGKSVPMPIFAGGFAAIEAEVVLQLDQDIAPGDFDPAVDSIEGTVRQAFIGVELASSPLSLINEIGPVCVVSDFGNNGGLVVGPQIENWFAGGLEGVTVTTEIEGAQVGVANVPALDTGPLAALQFLIANCAARGITLHRGTFVSTGAITGIHQAGPGARAKVTFGNLGSVRITLEEAGPR